jgi:hypothetical protein
VTDALIVSIALANGFKLKDQPDGSKGLNPYVLDFARALIAREPKYELVGFRCKKQGDPEDCWDWMPLQYLDQNLGSGEQIELIYTKKVKEEKWVK